MRHQQRHPTVTVNNVAPTVTLTGDATVNEGATHTYSFTVSDPGADTFTSSRATRLRHRRHARSAARDTFNAGDAAAASSACSRTGRRRPVVSVQVEDSDGDDSDSDTRRR